MIKKKLICTLALLLVISLFLQGCTKKAPISSPTATGTSTTATGTATTALQPTLGPPDKITIFLSSGGQTIPANFSYKNNDYFNMICKLANIEPVEVTVPEYADTKVKFSLMMASGNIPDVIHYNNFAEMSQYGKDGAFLEMSNILKNSATLSKLYTPAMIEAMKADDGKLYTLRSLPTEDGWHLTARLDLLNEVGYTSKLPSTLDEWVDALKKVKAKYPDSIPYTTTGVDNYHHFIFKPYGCESGTGWQYVGGKIINVFENPAIKEAILFGKKLLAEGLLDKEFATNKAADYTNKRMTKNSLIASMNLGSIGATIETYVKNNVDKAVIVPVKWPYVNESSLDPYSKYVPSNVVNNQCLSINSKTKQTAAAVRFVEALYSDKIKDAFIYGREGIEYTVASGKKVNNPEKQTETAWRNLYGMMFSYNPLEKTIFKCDMAILVTKGDASLSYKSNFSQYFDAIYKEDYKKVGYAPVTSTTSLIVLSTEANNLTKEAIAAQKSILLKAIMSEITIDEFAKQAGDLVKKYQSITDEYNKKLPDVKSKYGVK